MVAEPAVARTDVSPDGHRVLIDALAARFGGTAFAVIELARQLAIRPDVSNVIVATRRGSIVERGLTDDERVRCMRLRAVGRFELARRLIWEGARLPGIVAREHVDTVISMSGMLPRQPASRVICLLFNPVMYESGGIANTLRRWAVRRSGRAAVYLAAPTSHMATLVEADTGRACAVAPLGVDHELFRPSHTPGEDILCVADFYAHKRHDLVVDAWLLLPPPRPRLRLIGNPGVHASTYSTLLRRVAALPDRESITIESGIPLKRLIEAYQRARVFVISSEHESFCMPVAESMACGVPVVARGLQSLRETAGTGGRYVEGGDPTAWASAIARLFDDDVDYNEMRRAALESASRFSWERLATQIGSQLEG